MCGIFGYLSFDQQLSNIDEYRYALNQLVHRGPDESGDYISDKIFLGMRRLSIIDLAGGSQPIWNENNSICIVYNGELYNYRDIRPELESKGHVFRTNSDTEVILHGYEEWGYDCLQRLNGMFAFAIWNLNDKELFIVRDRIGEKPLYYYKDNQKLVFGSEIKAIIANPSIPRQLNYKGLSNFLAFGHAIAPDTIYENIYKLPAGHFLTVKGGDIAINQYWDVGSASQTDALNLSETEYEQRILKLLDDSVQRRMIADVPVGAFLSGGVDSSAIVALMKKHATASIKTFSLGFDVGGAYNELSEAKQVAKYLKTDHHELLIDSPDLVETLRMLVYHYDEPFGDAAGFPIYLLSQFARQHVKVVLTGDGGDELFGGYRRYVADQWAHMYQMLPQLLTRGLFPSLVNQFPRLRRIKKALNTLHIKDPSLRYANWLVIFSPELREQLFKSYIASEISDYDPGWQYPIYYNGLNGNTVNDHQNRLMYVDLKSWLVDVYMEKNDKASMAASLEARIPLLDHRLVELAFQIPSKYKIKRGTTKAILKKTVSHLVPPEVIKRPKHGFAVPTDPWFRGHLRDFAFEVLLDPGSRNREYFDSTTVERLWKEHETGRHVWDTQLWLLLNFELWHRIYLDRESI